MDSGKVTAVATSVIAVSILGFAFSGIYNDPKNVKDRCTAKYAKKLYNQQPSDLEYFIWAQIVAEDYNECLGYRASSDDLIRYKLNNSDKF